MNWFKDKMKILYIISTILILNSCVAPENEEVCVRKFKGGDEVTFIVDTTIKGIVIRNGYQCDVYEVSYFDKQNINRFDEFNEFEIK